MRNGANSLYEFGPFRLDAASGTLWRGGDLVPLSPKAAELLRLLLERDGSVVSKQEIFDQVWAGTFVEDGVLTQNIYTLRNTLGRDETGRQYIETVPRRGYRFAGQVGAAELENGREEKNGPDPIGASSASSADVTVNSSGRLDDIDAGNSAEAASSVDPLPARSWGAIAVSAAAGLLILVGAGFAIFLFNRPAAETAGPGVAPIEQLKFQKITDSGDVVYPTVSPDGTLLAYVRLEDEQSSVWVKQVTDGSPLRTLPPTRKGYRSLAFSPDGRQLYFREEAEPGAVYQTPVLGGTPKRIADNVWSDFSLSPDGKQLAFVRRDEGMTQYLLMLAGVDGSGERRLAVRSSPWDFRGGSPGWSPDGTKLVIASGQQQQFFPKLLLYDVATGAETELKIPRWRSVYRALWLPDGKRLIVTARDAGERYSQMWMLSYPGGEVRRLTNDLESYFWLSMSADGRRLVTRQQRVISHVWLLPEGDASRARQLTTGERALDGYAGLAWTADGRLVFTSFANNTTDLYAMDADGGRIQLTENAGQDNTDPSASGGHIVFTSNRTGSPQIWRMDAEGGGQQQLTHDEQKRVRAVSGSISPDGEEVYFIRMGAGPAAIWKMPIRGGEPVKVSNFTDATAESFVSVSPDGKLLAYRHVSNRQDSESEERTIQIGVIASDGSGEPRIFDLPLRKAQIQWTDDSTAFYYAAGTFNSSSLMLQPGEGGPPQKVLEFPERIFSFAWSRGRTDLAIARGRLLGDAILINNLP